MSYNISMNRLGKFRVKNPCDNCPVRRIDDCALDSVVIDLQGLVKQAENRAMRGDEIEVQMPDIFRGGAGEGSEKRTCRHAARWLVLLASEGDISRDGTKHLIEKLSSGDNPMIKKESLHQPYPSKEEKRSPKYLAGVGIGVATLAVLAGLREYRKLIQNKDAEG